MKNRFLSCCLAILPCLATPLYAQDDAERRAEVPKTTTLSVDYSRVQFVEDIDPWQIASAQLGQRTSHGTMIGRVNLADRFGSKGAQFEADAYPKLWSGAYGYLNVGYSSSSIFPEWRSGAELFLSLRDAYEASFGYRQLRFGGTPTTLFTGALGKYVGNEWYSLRPYVHSSSSGTSASLGLTARHYYADGDHYVGARASFGNSPPDQVTTDLASLARQRSWSASVGGSGGLTGDLLLNWSLGYEHEELTSTRTRQSWTISTGLRIPL